MNSRLIRLLGVCLVFCLIIGLTLIPVAKVDAYYGGYTGGYPYTSGYGYAGFASPFYPTSYSSFGSLYGSGLGYTSGLYGGYGGYGGLGGYGGYGGLGGYGGYGGLGGYGGYGGLGGYGLGLYGGLGGYGGLGYASLLGGLGYGGLMGGLYGGLLGGYSSMYSPFGAQNLYYPVETTGGLTYQVPFMQIAPLLGMASLYNQLFPNLFNPQPQLPPVVNVTTPSTQFLTFPTPIGTFSIT